jgi:hypothetical protein
MGGSLLRCRNAAWITLHGSSIIKMRRP